MEKKQNIYLKSSFGEEISSLYNDKSLTSFSYSSSLGEPGNYPFTRGIHSSMYRSKFWTMRQYSGFGTAQETNKRFKN